jgi:hypothetical protein
VEGSDRGLFQDSFLEVLMKTAKIFMTEEPVWSPIIITETPNIEQGC